MSTKANSIAFDRCIDPILRVLDARQAREIIDYHTDEELQTRIEELAGKANEGELSEEERDEYEEYAHANRFIAVLQAKARKLLETQTKS